MKTLYIALLAALAAGVIALVACSDAFSTDEASPLANDADKVCGHVYKGLIPQPGTAVFVFKKEPEEQEWTSIGGVSTNAYGYYEFHLGDEWEAGWDGMVDATNDLGTGYTLFSYPLQGPVVADIQLY
ncbi:MAG TPA: hypothetical protein VM054_10300 [bacterium]|nr:hypothetical protein [bacterium]